MTILAALQRAFLNLSVVQQAKNTLYLTLNGITTSMFTYRYPLVAPAVETPTLRVASLADIAAMKAQAIIQRGTKRDFVDMFVLLRQLDLTQVMAASQAKYGTAHNPYLVMQALTYFADADAEPLTGRNAMLQAFDWPKVKAAIIGAVSEFRKQNL